MRGAETAVPRRGSVLPGLAPGDDDEQDGSSSPPRRRQQRSSLARFVGGAIGGGASGSRNSTAVGIGGGGGRRMQGGRRAMPDLDAMASQIQHEAEMNDTIEMGSYLQKTLADREQADREFAAQGGWMGLGRRRKGGSGGSTSFTRKRKYKLPDEDEDDEEKKHLEENMWKYYRLITPSGHFKQRWDPFIQLLVVYNSTFIPLSLAFAYRLETTHTIIDYAVDLLFVVFVVLVCGLLCEPGRTVRLWHAPTGRHEPEGAHL